MVMSSCFKEPSKLMMFPTPGVQTLCYPTSYCLAVYWRCNVVINVANFVMGVYLVVISVADGMSVGSYFWHDRTGRTERLVCLVRWLLPALAVLWSVSMHHLLHLWDVPRESGPPPSCAVLWPFRCCRCRKMASVTAGLCTRWPVAFA